MDHDLTNRPDLNEMLRQNSGLAFHYCKITAEWFDKFEAEIRSDDELKNEVLTKCLKAFDLKEKRMIAEEYARVFGDGFLKTMDEEHYFTLGYAMGWKALRDQILGETEYLSLREEAKKE